MPRRRSRSSSRRRSSGRRTTSRRRSSRSRSQRPTLRASYLRRRAAAEAAAAQATPAVEVATSSGSEASAAAPAAFRALYGGKIGVQVRVGRNPKTGEVVACASQGMGRTRASASDSREQNYVGKRAVTECASGRNVRVAVAGALRKVARKIESRSGLFNGLAGLSGGKRRRRRRR